MLNFEPLERLGRIVTTSKAKAKVPRNEIATALIRHARSVGKESNAGPLYETCKYCEPDQSQVTTRQSC